MTLNDFENKKIAILGLGIENYALIKFLLKKKVDCNIIICDARNRIDLGEKYNELKKYNLVWRLGKDYNKKLFDFDLILRSPGYPLFDKSLVNLKSTIITSPINLFFDLCPSENIIGVTGTKGKGTTSSLIYNILKQGNKKVFLGGNIGVAPFEFIEKIKKTDWIVLELSSFQLEDIESSPKIAVITNFSKEHLAPADPNNPNYHKSIKLYWQSKLRIIKWQTKQDYFIVNIKLKTKINKFKQQFKNKLKSKIIYFEKSSLNSKLPGEHNKENISAAVEVAKLIKIKKDDIKQAVAKFKGLEYRIELIRSLNSVKYYNDSFATTPESAITALKSFNQPIILLAGGADKGSDFKDFAKEIKNRVKFVILLQGNGTDKIKKELIKIKYPKIQIQEVDNIKTAVKLAYEQARINDIVLLSTACASFGMFKNYKERGKLFTKEVEKIK